MGKWAVLAVLATAQFLMVLDQAVMNVAISQLVEDFDTTVTTIQMVIALYALVMAGLMLTGGKLGDLFGRRRAFAVGLCIYAVGSGLTAASWSVPSLMFGWSILEGIGAALVLPAMVALVAGNYKGSRSGDRLRRPRRRRRGRDRRRPDPRRLGDDRVQLAAGLRRRGHRLDRHPDRHPPDQGGRAGGPGRGARLGRQRSLGLGAGADRLRRPPGEQLGLAAAARLADRAVRVLADPLRDRRRGGRPCRLRRLGAQARGAWPDAAGPPPPLPDPALRGGTAMLLAQNMILMGIFFTIPLYLQIVQGLDALETGVRMLPASVGLFVTALVGSALAGRFAPGPWSGRGC